MRSTPHHRATAAELALPGHKQLPTPEALSFARHKQSTWTVCVRAHSPVTGLRPAPPPLFPYGVRPTGLIKALDNARFDLGGLQVHYSEKDHSGLEFTDVSIVGPDGKFWR